MWRLVVLKKQNALEQHNDVIFSVEEKAKQETRKKQAASIREKFLRNVGLFTNDMTLNPEHHTLHQSRE
jgi:menaquinone-dependent protoporphyrinogen IX oxidase